MVGTSQTTLGLACITPDVDDDCCFGNMVETLLIHGANVDWQGVGACAGALAVHKQRVCPQLAGLQKMFACPRTFPIVSRLLL